MFGYNSFPELVVALIAVLFAIILHELAHGVVALWNGDPTAKNSGRLTVNPLAHFDALGFVMLVVMRFGYAKPVPINPYNFKKRKLGMLTVSLAGIVTNFLLAFICAPIYVIGYNNEFVRLFFSTFIIINLNLCLFNLLPLYPLDGSRVLECFLKPNSKLMQFLKSYSMYILLTLFAFGIVRDFFSLPIYFDPLSWYITSGVEWIWQGIIKFWMLIL